MQYLINRNEDYPFKFFTESAFHKEQVVGYITHAYEELTHQETVMRPNSISHKDIRTFTLGKIGRIVKLGEDHYDLFFDESHNEYIRQLAEKHNGDLLKVTDEYLEIGSFMSVSNDMAKLFEHDIRTVFERENMFYLNSSIPFDSLWFFQQEGQVAPFCEENLNKLFMNIPIVRVW